MHRLPLLALVLLAGSALADEKRIFIPDQPFDMQHIQLDVAIDLPKERVAGTAFLRMTALANDNVVELDAVDFEITGDVLGRMNDGAWATFVHRYDGEKLGVFLPTPPQRGTSIELKIPYRVEEPKSGLSFFSPEKNGKTAPLQVWSQGESIENRYWVPCFDHPNEMQTTEIIATVDSKFEVLSNGSLKSRRKLKDGRVRFHWSMSKPHVVYLMTLVVGEFHVSEETWRGIPVTYYVPKDHASEVEPTFRNTTVMLDLFTDKLGIKYPWEKYAQVCCYNFGGGMENTSATTLGEASILDEHTRLDRSADGLIAHELAHQWFGDLVTCRDWAHLWLNEGFASYFEVIWEEKVDGQAGLAYDLMGKARSAIRGGKTLPIVHTSYDHPDDQFDARAYPKGAWVVHMLRRELGDEVFWEGLETYLREFAHQPVETADLRRVLERVSGRSLERFFYDWTARPGHPVVALDYRWVAEDKLAEVTVRQTQKAEAFHFPLEIEFHADGEMVRLQRQMRGKEEKFLVPLAFRPQRISIDPHMRVLMELDETKPRSLWMAQAVEDANPVNRIAAIRHLGNRLDDQIEALLHQQLQAEPFWGVRKAIVAALRNSGSDATRDALLAALQDGDARVKADVVQQLSDYDEKRVQRAVGKILRDAQQSYAVRAAAIDTTSAWLPEDLLQRIKPMLKIENPRDTIRSAALTALGVTGDEAAIELLLPYTSDAYSTRLRRTAVTSLGQVLEDVEPSSKTLTKVSKALASCVTQETSWLQMPAARVLRDIGPDARTALPALRKALKKDPNSRTRDMLEQAITRLEPKTPQAEDEANTWDEDAIAANDKLKDDLKTLRGKYETLQKRVDALEALLKGYQARMEQMTSEAGRGSSTGSGSTSGT